MPWIRTKIFQELKKQKQEVNELPGMLHYCGFSKSFVLVNNLPSFAWGFLRTESFAFSNSRASSASLAAARMASCPAAAAVAT